MAIFLVVALVTAGMIFPGLRTGGNGDFGVLGGPRATRTLESLALEAAAFARQPIAMALGSSPLANSSPEYSPLEQSAAFGALVDPGEAAGPSRDSLIIYKVQKGDTLYGIAAYFGVSLDTIINANPGVKARLLREGDELNILPTNGIVYTTRDGDTLESVANYFGVPEEKISGFNKSVNFGSLGVGVNLVIPGAKISGLAYRSFNSLPNFSANFTRPAEGYNWGTLHHYNAVDIAGSCGAPVRAAAEGLVVPDDSFGDGQNGWNGGYGDFVLIEHPFGDGVRTRYAHLSSVLVSIGDYVKQGQEIGLIGDTGDASGCHLHFEVYGAQNPFAK